VLTKRHWLSPALARPQAINVPEEGQARERCFPPTFILKMIMFLPG
jgi:hypothetical protein